ncbi:MAG: MFS transporter [Oscillospiraceae bacterium]|nr:MFS transporter [Oscillospiraceae bacterium]
MERGRVMNVLYSGVQAILWMGVCTANGYAAVYLQALGYSNTQLGLILAAGSLCGVALGLGLSAFLDAHPRHTAGRALPPVLLLEIAAVLALLWFQSAGALTSAAYVLYIAFSSVTVFLVPKLYVDLRHQGLEINFGVARGIGSLAYVLSSALLGIFVERLGIRVLSVTALALCLGQIALCRAICRDAEPPAAAKGGRGSGGSPMGVFLRERPRFCVLLSGMVCMFYAHNTVGNFMVNIVRNVGGGTAVMGYFNAFMAAVEIPVMLFFSRLRGSRSGAVFMRLAFVFFTLKIAAIAAAPNVPLLFAAALLQAPSFALEAVVVVDYVNETIPYEDSAKAQSLVASMSTFGSVLASLVSGRLFDTVGVRGALAVAAAVCAVGSVTGLVGLGNGEKQTLRG